MMDLLKKLLKEVKDLKTFLIAGWNDFETFSEKCFYILILTCGVISPIIVLLFTGATLHSLFTKMMEMG